MDVLLLVIDFLRNVVLFQSFFHGSILWCVFERFQLLTRGCITFLSSWLASLLNWERFGFFFLGFSLKSAIAAPKFHLIDFFSF